jgi:nitrogen fixation protein NifU and related proteins
MNNDLQELYQETILEHNRHPRNFGAMTDASASAAGYNPNCGDDVKVFIKKDEKDVIQDISFVGQGCAISKASASLMTEAVKGLTQEDALAKISAIVAMLSTETDHACDVDADAIGDLQALLGVRQFPARVKCATLPWHALKAALEGKSAVKMEG